jgi:hypothetical protein
MYVVDEMPLTKDSHKNDHDVKALSKLVTGPTHEGKFFL